MNEQPASIERFRLTLVPATVIVAFGCLLVFGASSELFVLFFGTEARPPLMDPLSIAFHGKKATLLMLAGVFCFVGAWLVMIKRWVAVCALALVIYSLLNIVERVHNNEL